jgi:hypothetical protein
VTETAVPFTREQYLQSYEKFIRNFGGATLVSGSADALNDGFDF